MDIVQRGRRGKGELYTVYTLEEVKEKGIEYRYWKDATVGDWSLSDDGYVGECLSRKVYTDKHNRTKTFIKFSYGVAWLSKNSKLLYEPNRTAGVYVYAKPDKWEKKEVKTTRAKRVVDAYITMAIAGRGIDWDVLGNLYRPDQKIPAATVRRFFKSKETQKMVDNKLSEILTEKGFTKEAIIDLHNEALEMSRNKGDVSNFLRTTENIMDLLQMKPGTKTLTESVEVGLSTKITDLIAQEDKRVKIEQTREIEGDIVEDK